MMAQTVESVGSISVLGGPDNPQVLAPRPDSLRVLPTHDPRNLNQVIQIMDRPRSEMLSEGHSTEFGMLAVPFEIGCCQAQSHEALKTLRA
jgi:hypothetical protein